ncbi:MAG: 3'(2'),5'-bisphosphate nucleotidase CysQ [Pseudomonadota bacterium]
MQGLDRDLDILIEAARRAGEIATRHREKGIRSWEKPDDAGPLTDADLEIDAMLKETLTKARPNYGWLSEETPDTPARLERESVFVIDPIDGTRAYSEGRSSFSHSLGLVRHGVPVAGVVYLPVLDRLYAAAEGHGAYLNGERLQMPPRDELTAGTVLGSRKHMREEYWPGGPPPLEPAYRSSFANRLALVAQDRFDAVVSFRDAWEWDIAAGVVILQEAGGRVTDRDGRPMRFNSPGAKQAGVLAANPTLHRQLLDRARGAAA